MKKKPMIYNIIGFFLWIKLYTYITKCGWIRFNTASGLLFSENVHVLSLKTVFASSDIDMNSVNQYRLEAKRR